LASHLNASSTLQNVANATKQDTLQKCADKEPGRLITCRRPQRSLQLRMCPMMFTFQDNAHDLITKSINVPLTITIELDIGALLSLINKASCNLISQNGQFIALKKANIKLRRTYEKFGWYSC